MEILIGLATLVVLALTLRAVFRYTEAAQRTQQDTHRLAEAATESNKLTSKLAEATIDPVIIIVSDRDEVNKYYAENVGKSVAVDISLEETDSTRDKPDIRITPINSVPPGERSKEFKKELSIDQSQYNKSLESGRRFKLEYFNMDKSCRFSSDAVLYHKDYGPPKHENFKRELYKS